VLFTSARKGDNQARHHISTSGVSKFFIIGGTS